MSLGCKNLTQVQPKYWKWFFKFAQMLNWVWLGSNQRVQVVPLLNRDWSSSSKQACIKTIPYSSNLVLIFFYWNIGLIVIILFETKGKLAKNLPHTPMVIPTLISYWIFIIIITIIILVWETKTLPSLNLHYYYSFIVWGSFNVFVGFQFFCWNSNISEEPSSRIHSDTHTDFLLGIFFFFWYGYEKQRRFHPHTHRQSMIEALSFKATCVWINPTKFK